SAGYEKGPVSRQPWAGVERPRSLVAGYHGQPGAGQIEGAPDGSTDRIMIGVLAFREACRFEPGRSH
ncbi:MAG TPA: hypothetical protein VLB67_15270, partial [Acidimicrobiia bacterium]|nr:hypothetical protein [Acidimicrobiia bacterium]